MGLKRVESPLKSLNQRGNRSPWVESADFPGLGQIGSESAIFAKVWDTLAGFLRFIVRWLKRGLNGARRHLVSAPAKRVFLAGFDVLDRRGEGHKWSD